MSINFHIPHTIWKSIHCGDILFVVRIIIIRRSKRNCNDVDNFLLYGIINIGDVIKFAGIANQMMTAVPQLIITVYVIKAESVYLKTFFEFLDIENSMQNGVAKQPRPASGHIIKFCNVSFCYPGSNEFVLKNVSVVIKEGESTAIVGVNGSGKSTFIKLLCRLYDPTEGVITLNDIDLREYSKEELQNLYAIVFQDFNLFGFTLRENLAPSNEEEMERLHNALEAANLSKTIARWNKGIDAVMFSDYAAGGFEVSGGEAQKIAIARAIYKNTSFLVLDEPTAALDPDAEYEIYLQLSKIQKEKTLIFISHRLSSCRFCKRILVFFNGEIVQHGSRGELLLDLHGKYYHLWMAQAKHYADQWNPT